MLPTIDTTLSSFQDKIVNNIVFLNKRLYIFGIANTALCSFCKTLEETTMHIFYDCIYVKSLWEKPQTKFQNDIILPDNIYNLLNHILLVFEYYVCRSREKHMFNRDNLIHIIIEIKEKEKQISLVNNNKTET